MVAAACSYDLHCDLSVRLSRYYIRLIINALKSPLNSANTGYEQGHVYYATALSKYQSIKDYFR